MRIIKQRLKQDTRMLLAEFAKEQHMPDAGYVEDVYALMIHKGKGVPTEGRLRKLIKFIAKRDKVSDLVVSTLAKKRGIQLKSVAGNALFKALCAKRNRVDAVRTLLLTLEDLSRKVRQAQCVTCTLLNSCDFGKQYKDVVKDIKRVLDPDYSKKVHQDCPSLPEIDSANRSALAAEKFAQMMRKEHEADLKAMQTQMTSSAQVHDNPDRLSDEELKEAKNLQEEADAVVAAGADDSDDDYDCEEDIEHYAGSEGAPGQHSNMTSSGYTSRAGETTLKVMEDLIRKLLPTNLAIFEVGTKFSLTMTAKKSGKFKPVQNIDHSANSTNIKSLADESNIEASQHGLPQEVFDKKLHGKSLTKQQHLQPTGKKALLYLVIDNSASVAGWLGGNRTNKVMTRSALLVTLALASIRRVRDDKGIVFTRFFNLGISRLYRADDAASFRAMEILIAKETFSGGGTNILQAVKYATDDIAAAKDEIARAELLLCTDAEDNFEVGPIKKAVGKIELNVLDISGSGFTNQGASLSLRAVATKYFKANENSINISGIVDLI